MYEVIKNYIKKQNLLTQGSKVVVGISGGADSVCLLDFLCSIRQDMKLEIFGVHIHHGIRGESADQDAEFSKKLCEKYEVPYTCFYEQVEVRAKKEKRSVEEMGRLCRYERLEQVRKETKSDVIAVAHHKNDQAETILFHLVRGSGVAGLSGILPKRGNIIRPLLCVTKEEILTHLERSQIPYCIDPTNEELCYSRNRIRNQWIPLMEEENKGVVSHLCQMSEIATYMQDYIRQEGEKCYIACCMKKEKERVILSCHTLKNYHICLQLEVIRMVIKEMVGEDGISYEHIEMVRELMEKDTGRQRSLPRNLIVKKNYDELIFLLNEKKEENSTFYYELSIPEETEISEIDGKIKLKIVGIEEFLEKNPYFYERIEKDHYKKVFDYDKIEGRLIFRTRNSQDTICIHKDGKHKALRRFFIDEKIPREEREKIPLLVDEQEVLWIIGYRVSCKYEIDATTKRVLIVEYEKRTKEKNNG